MDVNFYFIYFLEGGDIQFKMSVVMGLKFSNYFDG